MVAVNGETLLTVDGLCKSFGGVHAVVDFSMELRRDHVVGLIGPNGAGKTTVFNLLSGIIPVDKGRVTFRGTDITNEKSYIIARLGIGRTFQNLRLFDGLSVADNVKAACCHDVGYSAIAAMLGMPATWSSERALNAKVDGLLELVGIAHCGSERARSLPYGLQRKVEIARALATNPQILFLDEPAAGLNPSEVVEMLSLIRSLHDEQHYSIFLIEHHMEVVMPVCDDIYVVNMGQTIAHGTPEEVQAHPEVLKAYLGE
ncbi:MAG TPA: ABC transporter ATP-binding protein [Chloroflexota bacterium]|nr:ABC transporter ATP-binding protein [Chloroflexota bacterium]